MKQYQITVNGKSYDVQVQEVTGATPAPVATPAPAPAAAPAPAPAAPAAAPTASAGAVKVESPMPGNILDIKVRTGQAVKAAEVLIILEAMKMENEIVAPSDGTVASIHVNKGDSVETGTLLVSLN